MADPIDETTTIEEPDYKALYEQAKADAEKWKSQSRKNESRAKANSGAAKSLEEVTAQLAELSERFAAIEGENATLKADAERAELVQQVAQATGVSADIVSSLKATDEEGLTAAATAIAQAYQTPGGAPQMPEAGMFPTGTATGSQQSMEQRFGQLFNQLITNP